MIIFESHLKVSVLVLTPFSHIFSQGVWTLLVIYFAGLTFDISSFSLCFLTSRLQLYKY